MVIPEIVDLLKESHGDACEVYTYAVAKLSEQGERANLLEPRFNVLTTIIAEFRAVIAPAIPGIVNFLKSSQETVHSAGTNALSKLSEQGETVNLSGQALLMNSQLNFNLQLAPPFLRLLTCSRTVMRAFVRQLQILCRNFENKVRQPSCRMLLY